MSKKITLDESQIAQVEALSAYLSIEQIADYCGFSEDTFYELKKRDPRVLRAYKKGKAKAIDKVARNLITLADQGDVTATIFYLKTQAGWSTENKRNNIKIGNGSAVEIINNTLTALNEGKISTPEAQQFSSLALAKINIETKLGSIKQGEETLSLAARALLEDDPIASKATAIILEKYREEFSKTKEELQKTISSSD